MMTRSRKGDSTRSTTEEETSGGDTMATGTTSSATWETVTDSTAATEHSTVVEDADITVVEKGKKKQPKTVSKNSSKRKKELEARLELEKLQLEEIRMKAKLANTKLELARADDTDLSDQEGEEEAEVEAAAAQATAAWVSTTKSVERNEGEPPSELPAPEVAIAAPSHTNHQLAEAILQAVKSASENKASSFMQRAPKYVSELHQFEGDARDWMAFKATYEDTRALFSDIENMGRLRRAVKGKAKESVKSLLFTQIDPQEVMTALERRFGRPTYLIRSEIENIEKLPPMSEDARELVRYAGAVSNTVSVVKQMKRQSYLHSSDISSRIIEKMCTLVRFKWYEYRAKKEDEDEPILLSLMQFFNDMVDQFEMHEFVGSRMKKESMRFRTRTTGPRGVHTTRAARNQEDHTSEEDSEGEHECRTKSATVFSCKEDNRKEREKITCPQCKGEHTLLKCKKFSEASIKDKWEQAKKTGLCYKCLKGKHRGFSCKAKPCGKCKKGHHLLLHYEEATKPTTQETITQTIASTVNAARAVSRAYLKIVPVELMGPEGNACVYALMDEGSTVTLIEDSVVEKIGAQGPEEELRIEGVGGHRMDQKSKKIDVKIRGIFGRNTEKLSGYSVKNLHLTPQEVNEKDLEGCEHLEEIRDQLKYPNAKPSVLIGQDNWHLIVSQEVKHGHRYKPVASRTQLGWVLHGVRSSSSAPVRVVNHLVTQPSSKDDHLEKLIRDHFDIEALGIAAKKPSNDIDQRALQVLDATTKRLTDGRFSTGLIWKTEGEHLPESKTTAARRLKGIQKRFLKDVEFQEKYEEQINNLIVSEYAEEAKEEPTSARTWYLPHFAVVHPQKKKMRLVFDAAAKSNGRSLNDALLAGPDLLQSLFGVLLRFRQSAVAVVADIKEMFLRVKINEEDRDSLRFLWQDKEYRMTSLIFGAACSPCAAIYIKNKNASEFEKQYPEAARAITRNHYMDDYLASYPDVATARRIANDVDTVHKKGGFVLRGWASNHPEVIEELYSGDSTGTVRLGEQKDQVEKTLGLNWNVKEDSLHFTLTLRNTPEEAIDGKRAPTKREATSAVMTVFDPLGLAAPITIQGKIMLQNLWRSGVEWDEKIPPAREEEWSRWLQDLKKLVDLGIPRCLARDVDEGELHTFCDASEKAYACAVYWRARHTDGRVEVKLLAAKARVTPLKPTSIPRLELQACLLGSRLAMNAQQEMDLRITERCFWTDSKTALAWIKSDPRRYKPFVAHRLAEIEELTRHREWRWVPTKHNVADDATREAPKDFSKEHRWFTGPSFLYKGQEEWPRDEKDFTKDTGEEKPNAVTLSVRRIAPTIVPEPERFSRWTRLLHAAARFLQAVDAFKRNIVHKTHSTRRITKKERDPAWKKSQRKAKTPSNIKKSSKTPFILKRSGVELNLRQKSALYVEKAERLLIQRVQEDSYPEQLAALRRQSEQVHKLKNFAVKLEDGMIKLSSRIGAAKYLTAAYKNPIVLDGRHSITQLLVKHVHERLNHGNHQTVMNELRQRFWIPGLRNIVKATARDCGWCKLRKKAPQLAPQGDLPQERLSKTSPPFTCVGVDYFGPLLVTVGRRVEKRWGALFTCMTTRAVHLELAASLTTDSMILALRRMIARRGTPKVIMSDNGTNFVGASRELQEAIQAATDEIGIVWRFIPPGAPHMGGSWERLVRTVKTALAATLHERRPREEVLHTLLLEAEHVVNSRPLFSVSTDPNEEEALTPNHFLIGRSSGAHMFGSFDDAELIGSPSWRTSQRLADHFWARWVREYLPTLSPRYFQGPQYRDPTVGDLVLLVDHTLPRCSWPRGVISATYPGPDGRTRIVDVRTPAGVLRRPASRLVVIVPASSPLQAEVQGTEGETVGDAACEASTLCAL